MYKRKLSTKRNKDVGCCIIQYLLRSKALTVPSKDELNTTWLLGANVTPVTPQLCSLKVTKQNPDNMFHSLTCKAHKNTMTMRWAATFKTKTVYSIQLESNKICNGENQSSVNAWLSLKLGIAKRNSEERGLSIF